MPGQRADAEHLAAHRDPAQFGEPADIDDQFRGNQPQIHRRHQALAARQHLCASRHATASNSSALSTLVARA